MILVFPNNCLYYLQLGLNKQNLIFLNTWEKSFLYIKLNFSLLGFSIACVFLKEIRACFLFCNTRRAIKRTLKCFIYGLYYKNYQWRILRYRYFISIYTISTKLHWEKSSYSLQKTAILWFWNVCKYLSDRDISSCTFGIMYVHGNA